jgi:DNA-binding NtrC family response regulator
MTRPRIIVVDDDYVTCELLSEVFSQEGFETEFALNSETALTAIHRACPDVIVSDIRMKHGLEGLTLLEQLHREYPTIPVILITAFGSVDTAIRAVREGAFDYISKPFDMVALVSTVKRAIVIQSRPAASPSEDEEDETDDLSHQMLGRSPMMLEVYKLMARVADSSAAVVITGESGTGKELVARAIHRHSGRHHQPFVAVNCGALTETLLESELFGHAKGAFTGAISNRRGIFEQAAGGTVFLDEIGETSPALQVKLLRVLQEREVVPVGSNTPVTIRARVIAATNVDLEVLTRSSNFRRDLLYRLNVINIHLPPLRERREDIPLLAAYFVRKYTPPERRPASLSAAATSILTNCPWPGNVRELENAIERAVTLSRGGVITEDDFPEHVRQSPRPKAAPDDVDRMFAGLPTIDEMEQRYLLHVLQAAGGNRKRAADILGINRRTLYRMAVRFNLELQPPE